MSDSTVVRMLQELAAIQGVRAALIATSEGALADGRGSGLDASVAHDVAKTVRRMVVASTTVGAPMEELSINFGNSRLMVIPVREDATLTILCERASAASAVRRLLDVELERLRSLLSSEDEEEEPEEVEAESDDEVDRLLAGELGPVLMRVQQVYGVHAQRLGVHQAQAHAQMREQLREWLLCCNPSPYTFPLLLDGLSQTLNASPDTRADFMTEVQQIMRGAQVWKGGA